MLFAIVFGLNPAVHILVAAWLDSANPTSDPTSLFAVLGPFAAAAAALGFGWRDAAKQRDRAQDLAEAVVKSQTTILVEIRDALRTANLTQGVSTKAMETMAEALHRIPSEAEIVRLRDALAATDRPPPSSWRT